MINRYWRSLNKIWRSTQRSRSISVTIWETFLYYVALRIPALHQMKFRFQWKGHIFWARPMDDRAVDEVLLNQEYASAIRAVLQAPASPIVIDGGANIGLFSLVTLVARPDAIVHAFEPDARTFRILERNMRANPPFRWQIYPLALWKESGPLKFGATATSTSSRVYDLAPEGQVKMVDAITLETFVAQHISGNITLVKLDIEGAEEVVLARSESVLAQAENLVVEIHPGAASETRIINILRLYFPYSYFLSRHDSAKPLILASRFQLDLTRPIPA